MRTIPLSQGKVTLVDDEDYDTLAALGSWSAAKRKQRWYAVRGGRYMHRLIMDAPNGRQVDHRNGDGLDNQRSNLRLATNAQNNQNKGTDQRNTSGVRGVSVDWQTGRYRVDLHANGKHHWIGRFETFEEAVEARNRADREIHGEFAHEQ